MALKSLVKSLPFSVRMTTAALIRIQRVIEQLFLSVLVITIAYIVTAYLTEIGQVIISVLVALYLLLARVLPAALTTKDDQIDERLEQIENLLASNAKLEEKLEEALRRIQ